MKKIHLMILALCVSSSFPVIAGQFDYKCELIAKYGNQATTLRTPNLVLKTITPEPFWTSEWSAEISSYNGRQVSKSLKEYNPMSDNSAAFIGFADFFTFNRITPDRLYAVAVDRELFFGATISYASSYYGYVTVWTREGTQFVLGCNP